MLPTIPISKIELAAMNERLDEILEKKDSDRKNTRLAHFMSDLERIYNIPAMRSEEYINRQPYVMDVYMRASLARTF